MRYQIRHRLTYRYSAPVELGLHLLRLRPRHDGTQQLHQFQVCITPNPAGQADVVDLDGNATLQLWFDDRPAEQLDVSLDAIVSTHRPNPFNYLLEPWAATLPFDYPQSLRLALDPYCARDGVDPITWELAADLRDQANGNPVEFLGLLNQTIHDGCAYEVRETGNPHPAGLTWKHKRGSCRDFTVLFVEACRAVGLGARFVSGYEVGDPQVPHKFLHAWAEVYLPGGGWRGYDPTQGIAAADGYIAVAAAADPRRAAPFPGTFQGRGAHAQLDSSLSIEPLP